MPYLEKGSGRQANIRGAGSSRQFSLSKRRQPGVRKKEPGSRKVEGAVLHPKLFQRSLRRSGEQHRSGSVCFQALSKVCRDRECGPVPVVRKCSPDNLLDQSTRVDTRRLRDCKQYRRAIALTRRVKRG